MGDESDDPIRRRAREIRAEAEATARNEEARDADLRAERARFAQQFLDALTEKTTHAVECAAVDERPHGAIARFHFLRENRIWTQEMFEFGVDRIDGEPGQRQFLYYLEQLRGAFRIPNPATGVAKELSNASATEVIDYATVVSIEMMARVVASGGMLGSAAELSAAIVQNDRNEQRRQDAAKRERGKNFWTGCGSVLLAFLGFFVALSILSAILRSCSGG